ncbi:MAG: Cytochrome [Amycolatopsis sp.]|uniref:cytochrome P450 n=1 Tax=Amycolatopsis sp. TaxID=37632 RepID=UPI002608A72D|nr:cytochrome P450 [Amycolatopsis sp.]MCU1683599.1 Cytochrome [Amycolatopsis sp.]
MTEVADPGTITFPLPRTCPFAPPDEYRRLREEEPVTKVDLPNEGEQMWVVARHEDVRAVLADTRFSSNSHHPAYPRLNKSDGSAPQQGRRVILNLDPPEHGESRRSVVGEFTVRRMEALRPRIQQIVDQHIDAMLAGPKPVDLVAAFALPVPSLVICELLGVPYADHSFFETRSAKMVDRATPLDERSEASDAVMGYLHGLVQSKLAEPTEDLLGRLAAQADAADPIAVADLVGMAVALLVAGHETTANMIGLGVLAFKEHPDQLAIIREDPSKISNAVEELLRYFTVADTVALRVATEDIEVNGVTIPAGEGVLPLGYAANRDPNVYPDPDAFDIERGSRQHVAFGFGPHQCIGQNLARMELQIAFETLFRRLPNLELAVPVEELSFREPSALVFGAHAIPVTW